MDFPAKVSIRSKQGLYGLLTETGNSKLSLVRLKNYEENTIICIRL